MDIRDFIPSQRQIILERFQQIPGLSARSIRIEKKVANPVGIIYNCAILNNENYFSDRMLVGFRILYENDIQRISLDATDVPPRQSLNDYLSLISCFEGLQNYLNHEFTRVKNK
ncbi:hypothetical protein [Streptococcus dentiloxodontae]